MLLTADQIREYEDISDNVEDSRIDTRIQQMQDMDLKPFLGLAMYSDLLLNSSAEKYQNLINGVASYTDLQGNAIVFAGLKPAMVYFTIARFLNADKIRYTATGPKVKALDDSEQLKANEKAARVAELLSMGNAYINDVVYYIYNNRDTYPLWNFSAKNRNLRQPGVRIRAIDKNNYNGFNAPVYYNGFPFDVFN